MNPPSVYELTNPSSHSTRRITNIVQSIGLFLSVKHTYLRTSHFRCAYAKQKFLRFLQRSAQIPVTRLEQAASGFVITLRDRAVRIDHEVTPYFPESNHRAGADNIECDLCCSPG